MDNSIKQICIHDLAEFLMAFKNYSAKETIDFIEEFTKGMEFKWDKEKLAKTLYMVEAANIGPASPSPSPSPEIPEINQVHHR